MTKKIDQEESKIITDLHAKCDEYLNGWKRSQADYQNLKREHEGQMGKLMEAATSGLVLGLLPIIDHFELALKHVPEEESKKDWVQGLAHIKKQFDDFLAKCGITRVETVGKKFDPNLHEAISTRPAQGGSDSVGEDEIIEEAQAGYLLNNQVLRHAKVVVSK